MEQSQLQAVWEQILDNMKEQLAASAFKWLNPVKPLSLTDSELVLGAQNAMSKEWITSHYLTILEDAVADVLGTPHKIVMKVIEAEKPEEPEAPAAPVRRPAKGENPDQGTLFQEGNGASAPAETNDMHIMAAGEQEAVAKPAQLREGVTAQEIEQIPVAEIRNMAKAMLAGTYSTEFRIGEFTAFRPLTDLQGELKNSYLYNNHENPTGITFDEDESVIVMVEGIGEQPVALQVRNFGPTVFASSTYALQNGINVIKVSNKGNGYINYYTTSWKTAPKVKMHFLNAKEQGYFSPKYKGHTNDDWKRLLANAKGDCLDMHGEFTDCVFPVSSFKANCPNDGEWLMAIYDSIISVERDIMGIYKYKHEFPNRQCAITVATSGGLYHASNDGFCVPVNALRDPTSRTHYDIWGAAHEYGHQNQTQGLRWIGLTEVTNNIMSAYVEHKLRTDGYHRLENESNGFRYYDFFEYNVMKGGQFVPHAHNDVFCTLVPFWQLLIYTRIAGIQPDAYPELYETLRNQSALSSMSDGQHQVNFMKQWCHITKTNFLPYFKQVGMFKTVDESISDYSTRQLTITQAMLDNLEKEINAANYPEPPAAFCYIDVNNYPAFRDKAALVANTVGKGCSVSGNTVRIQHNQWKNVVGFETYKADGTLLHMTNYGHGDSAYKPTMTSVVWNTSEKPAYIMAVGYDGTRVKCYEP